MSETEKKLSKVIEDVKVELLVVLGETNLRVNQLLKLGRGAVVELDKNVADTVEVYADDVLVGRGEIVVTENDMMGIEFTELRKDIKFS